MTIKGRLYQERETDQEPEDLGSWLGSLEQALLKRAAEISHRSGIVPAPGADPWEFVAVRNALSKIEWIRKLLACDKVDPTMAIGAGLELGQLVAKVGASQAFGELVADRLPSVRAIDEVNSKKRVSLQERADVTRLAAELLAEDPERYRNKSELWRTTAERLKTRHPQITPTRVRSILEPKKR